MKTLLRHLNAAALLAGVCLNSASLAQTQPTFVVWPSSVDERFGGSVAQVVIERRGDRELAVSVDVRVDEAIPPASRDQFSATKNVDFTPVSQRLHFASGETNKVVEVTILDDGEPEWNEFFRVTLSQPSPGAVIANGSADWFIYDNEVPALYDVTQTGYGFESQPFVLLTEGADSDLPIRPQWLNLRYGGVLVSGESPFTHINGVPRPNLARLLPDGNLDADFVPSESSDPHEISDAFGAKAVLPLRSGQILLGPGSGLLRLNRDGSKDSTFRPPIEPSGLRPIAELEDGSVYVSGGTNQILRLDMGGSFMETVFIKELANGAGFTGAASATWMPEPAPGRFLVYGAYFDELVGDWGTLGILPDATIVPNFTPFPGRAYLSLSAGRLVTSNGSVSYTVRHPDGTLDRSWMELVVGMNQAGGLASGRGLSQHNDRLWVPWHGQWINNLFAPRGPDTSPTLAFHLTAARAPSTALQVGLTDYPREPAENILYPLGFKRLGRSDAPASAHYAARVVTALSRQVTVYTGTVSFAPFEVQKTVNVALENASGPNSPSLLEVTITAAEGFEALPAPYIWGAAAPRLNRVKRLRDGRVLLGGGGQQDTTKLEFSTDLKAWHPLTSLLGGFNDSDAVWLDASANNAPTRFYRAVAP